jgi:hypothetical protein
VHVARQGTGQGTVLVPRQVADDVAVKVADEVARLVPREAMYETTSSVTSSTTWEAVPQVGVSFSLPQA